MHLRGDNYVLRMTCDEVEITFPDSKGFFTCFKREQVEKAVEEWKSKSWQGRIARTEDIDHSLSNSHLSNLKLSDSLVRFVVKARLQLTECNSLLHIYYPADYPRSCPRCGFSSDTISHILNNCRYSKGAIQARHNRLAKIVTRAVSGLHSNDPAVTVLEDKLVKPAHFTQAPDTSAFDGVRSNRPDICVIDHANKTCHIIELAVPFDSFVGESYQMKFDKYLPLCQRISDLGYTCKVIALIVGSLGCVHTRFVSGLRMAGLSAARARAIARYCAVSAMIGSRIIWKQRVKAILP